MNNISKLNKKKCTGCIACKNISPQKCISIINDELGFEYPQIDQAKCVKCGMCSKVCPELNNNNNSKYEIVFAAINKNFESWKNSSSGGVFKALCEKYCEIYPVTTIYGASYDTESMSIKHIGVKLNNIKDIQKSKYVQSSMGNIYSEITTKIKNNGNKFQRNLKRKQIKNLFCAIFWRIILNIRVMQKNFKKKTGFELIYVSTKKLKCFKLKNKKVCGIEDFVYYIRNAEYVLTDSFHGLAFSINLNKKFPLFKRFDDNNRICQNSRIYNLLDLTSFDDYPLNPKSEVDYLINKEFDYSLTNNKIKEERKKV